VIDIAKARAALLQADVLGLYRQLEPVFPDEAASGSLLDLVLYAAGRGPAPAGNDDVEELFLNSIAESRRILEGAPLPSLKHYFIGPELDFLCDRGGIQSWGLAQLLNYLLIGLIQPSRRSAVVAAMRDDGIYILQWVAYYLVLGFDHIFIYTNDNSDGSEELLRALADHGVITLVESETFGKSEPESKAFGHAIHLLHEFRAYEWILFVDSDEYFVPGLAYDNSVGKVISAIPEQVSGVCYRWMWFVSGMVYRRTPELLIERFQHARPHQLTKCLARLRDVTSMRFDHHAELIDASGLVDCLFQPINQDMIFRKPPQYAGGRINHYWSRSFEEFAVKKARGSTLDLEKNLYDRPYAKFFAWNDFETSQNYLPTDPDLLSRVKERIDELKKLEGVAEAARLIEQNFPYLVHLIAEESKLQDIYAASKINPEPI
jgi:glycosyl transferase family 2